MKASAKNGIAIATQNLKNVTAVSVAQFQSNLEAFEKVYRAPEFFAGVSKGMKKAAAKVESFLESALKNGVAAVKKAHNK